MSSPAYHLRTNKAVERLLFIELLRKLDSILPRNISTYEYVSMGGPYLEDFTLMHGIFGLDKMTSLETEEYIRKRQRINRPCSDSSLKLTLLSTSEFVDKYEPGERPAIIWFDYEGSNWKQQISESCELLLKLPPMSIFKITLTGNTRWLGGGGVDPLPEKAQRLSEIFEDFGPFEAEDLQRSRIVDTLYAICRKAIAAALPDTLQKVVRTLAAYQYDDGTPILTVTFIVGPLDVINLVLSNKTLSDWPFTDVNWSGPTKIAIPSLSLREKLAIDRLIPGANARAILKALDLRLESKYRDSVRAMEQYLLFHRQVPHFLRISL